MKLTFVLLFLVISSSASGRYFDYTDDQEDVDNNRLIISKRLLNGEAVPIQKAPFMALVKADRSFMSTYPFATAVIISNRFLLSSASFFFIQRGKHMTAYLGESDLKSLEGNNKYGVKNVFIHRMFNERLFHYYNIALIELEQEIEFNDMQRPIVLLSDNDVYERGIVLMQMYSYGLSKKSTDEETLGMLTSRNVKLDSNVLLTSGPIIVYSSAQICPGDDGAPLIMNNKLAALTADKNECSNELSSHFIVTGVLQYYSWIEDVVGKDSLYYAEQSAYSKKDESDNTLTF